jgi:hypothetical protein
LILPCLLVVVRGGGGDLFVVSCCVDNVRLKLVIIVVWQRLSRCLSFDRLSILAIVVIGHDEEGRQRQVTTCVRWNER